MEGCCCAQALAAQIREAVARRRSAQVLLAAQKRIKEQENRRAEEELRRERQRLAEHAEAARNARERNLDMRSSEGNQYSRRASNSNAARNLRSAPSSQANMDDHAPKGLTPIATQKAWQNMTRTSQASHGSPRIIQRAAATLFAHGGESLARESRGAKLIESSLREKKTEASWTQHQSTGSMLHGKE